MEFLIPDNEEDIVHVTFKVNIGELALSLNIRTGEYAVSEIPKNRQAVKDLYEYADTFLEEIKYLGNNALDFIMGS